MVTTRYMHPGVVDSAFDARDQRVITAAEHHPLGVAGTTVNRHHRIAARDELQAYRFVKAMARDVQRIETTGFVETFEQVQIEIPARDRARDRRGAPFNTAAVRRDDGDGGFRADLRVDAVIRAVSMRCREARETAVTIGGFFLCVPARHRSA